MLYTKSQLYSLPGSVLKFCVVGGWLESKLWLCFNFALSMQNNKHLKNDCSFRREAPQNYEQGKPSWTSREIFITQRICLLEQNICQAIINIHLSASPILTSALTYNKLAVKCFSHWQHTSCCLSSSHMTASHTGHVRDTSIDRLTSDWGQKYNITDSEYDDGGPCSWVCARKNLRSAPHQHTCKFSTVGVCRINFKLFQKNNLTQKNVNQKKDLTPKKFNPTFILDQQLF